MASTAAPNSPPMPTKLLGANEDSNCTPSCKPFVVDSVSLSSTRQASDTLFHATAIAKAQKAAERAHSIATKSPRRTSSTHSRNHSDVHKARAKAVTSALQGIASALCASRRQITAVSQQLKQQAAGSDRPLLSPQSSLQAQLDELTEKLKLAEAARDTAIAERDEIQQAKEQSDCELSLLRVRYEEQSALLQSMSPSSSSSDDEQSEAELRQEIRDLRKGRELDALRMEELEQMLTDSQETVAELEQSLDDMETERQEDDAALQHVGRKHNEEINDLNRLVDRRNRMILQLNSVLENATKESKIKLDECSRKLDERTQQVFLLRTSLQATIDAHFQARREYMAVVGHDSEAGRILEEQLSNLQEYLDIDLSNSPITSPPTSPPATPSSSGRSTTIKISRPTTASVASLIPKRRDPDSPRPPPVDRSQDRESYVGQFRPANRESASSLRQKLIAESLAAATGAFGE